MDRNLFFYFSSTIKSNFTLECHHLWCQLLRLKTTVFSLQNKKRRQEWEEMNTTIKTWETFHPSHSCPSLKQNIFSLKGFYFFSLRENIFCFKGENTIYNLRYKRKRATIPSLLLKKHTYFLHLLETKKYWVHHSKKYSALINKKKTTIWVEHQTQTVVFLYIISTLKRGIYSHSIVEGGFEEMS